MMTLYAIADLHLPLGTGEKKSMNIFNGWENYVDRIEKNWRKLVNPEDTVVIAGDFSWAMRLEEAFEDFKFIESLPGRKILLKGNHDYWWSTRKKIETYLSEKGFSSVSILHNSMQEVGSVAVCGTRGWFYDSTCESDMKILNREVMRLEFSISLARKTDLEPVVFLHYPPIYRDFKCEEILKVLAENKIKRCYYGHLHGKKSISHAFIGEYEGINFQLISGDAIGFNPVLVQ